MSLKAVELQIAIPKTFEAGKIADQHQQNVIHQQMNANEALKKELERKQLAVNTAENADAVTEEDEGSGNGGSQSSMREKKNGEQELPKAHHPFKGNFIDYTG